MRSHSDESDYEHIEVRKVGGNIGAEIGGVVAGTELADEAVRELRLALLRHRVVFLRGQHSVDACQFFEITARDTTPSAWSPDRALAPRIGAAKERRIATHRHTDLAVLPQIRFGPHEPRFGEFEGRNDRARRSVP